MRSLKIMFLTVILKAMKATRRTITEIGANSVPRFYDIDGDGNKDLVVSSLNAVASCAWAADYFPYREKLPKQLDGFKDRGIYVGVHALSNEYADSTHDQRELEYQKNAFESRLPR